MKSLKILVLLLSLTVLPLAQTAAADSNPPAQSTAKADCPCCQKMSDGKDGKSCSKMHHDMAARDAKPMSCCSEKDGKSCMKGDKKEMACAKDSADAKDCCKKDGDKSAMACCDGGQCGMHDAAPDGIK